MSEKLTGISSNGQELIKGHNFDPNLIDYIREKEQRITEFLNHAEAFEAEVKALKEIHKILATPHRRPFGWTNKERGELHFNEKEFNEWYLQVYKIINDAHKMVDDCAKGGMRSHE